ncbi:hypothetical protein [Gluconobacter potus]|uniref:hypothetical protein n=1 Tax=Gluconobacter potus TaxID=2724927 RepID=UPI000B0BCAF3|nr:hypothetical protein [Gluconobacter potus]
MTDIESTDVFTPYQYPLYTYVERKNDYEKSLRDGLRTPGLVISLSGPSKSGKTVLVQNVIGSENIIRINGTEITDASAIWNIVLDRLKVPTQLTKQDSTNKSDGMTGGLGYTLGIPTVASFSGTAQATDTTASSQSDSFSYTRSGISQVSEIVKVKKYIIFIDDFHYMDRKVQVQVAKQLKAGAEIGIRSCAASVPHRSDDVLRANPELHGRVKTIDIKYWSIDELKEIAKKGFEFLNMNLSDQIIEKLSVESCGSPQLMQALCLNTCFTLGINKKLGSKTNIDVPDGDYETIKKETSTFADFSTIVEALHTGPKTHGTDRNIYDFIDGTKGDMYRAILLAISLDPPKMTIPYSALVDRVKNVCLNNHFPSGRNISDACEQFGKLLRKSMRAHAQENRNVPIEWDKTVDPEILHIAEPYFLFYLRSSNKIISLGEEIVD